MAEIDRKSVVDQLIALRYRISTRLGLAIASLVFFALFASFVGLIYLDRIIKAQERVYEASMPDMEAAFSFSLKSSEIVSAAPRLTSALTENELTPIRAEVEASKQEFREQLASILNRDLDQAIVERVANVGESMLGNLDLVSDNVSDRIALTNQLNSLHSDFNEVDIAIRNQLVSAIDAQLFYLVTGYQTRDVAPDSFGVHFTIEEFNLYRYVTELRRFGTIGAQLLSTAISLSEGALIESFKDRFGD